MTVRSRFRQSELLRAIEAVQKAGARIEPDGTIVVLTGAPGGIPANDRNPMDRILPSAGGRR